MLCSKCGTANTVFNLDNELNDCDHSKLPKDSFFTKTEVVEYLKTFGDPNEFAVFLQGLTINELQTMNKTLFGALKELYNIAESKVDKTEAMLELSTLTHDQLMTLKSLINVLV